MAALIRAAFRASGDSPFYTKGHDDKMPASRWDIRC